MDRLATARILCAVLVTLALCCFVCALLVEEQQFGVFAEPKEIDLGTIKLEVICKRH